MADTPDLEARVAELESAVAHLMEVDRATAAWLHFRRMTDVAYRDIFRVQEAAGVDHDGVMDFIDRHGKPRALDGEDT